MILPYEGPNGEVAHCDHCKHQWSYSQPSLLDKHEAFDSSELCPNCEKNEMYVHVYDDGRPSIWRCVDCNLAFVRHLDPSGKFIQLDHAAKFLAEKHLAYQAEGHPAQVEIVPGALSTPCHDYSLIPAEVWVELVSRFELGEERKGDKAWNAKSFNQHILLQKKFVLDRINHAIQHLLNMQQKLIHNDDLSLSDNDPAAVLWAGAFLTCSRNALIRQQHNAPDKSASTRTPNNIQPSQAGLQQSSGRVWSVVNEAT